MLEFPWCHMTAAVPLVLNACSFVQPRLGLLHSSITDLQMMYLL